MGVVYGLFHLVPTVRVFLTSPILVGQIPSSFNTTPCPSIYQTFIHPRLSYVVLQALFELLVQVLLHMRIRLFLLQVVPIRTVMTLFSGKVRTTEGLMTFLTTGRTGEVLIFCGDYLDCLDDLPFLQPRYSHLVAHYRAFLVFAQQVP